MDENRDKKGRFLPGNKANKNGRPRSPEVAELRKALARAKKKMGVSLIDHCIQKAYDSDYMAAQVLRKILPDLQKLEAEVQGNIIIEIVDRYGKRQDKNSS